MVKVSIIIPVYNCHPYLRKCVDSVLVQDFYDYELLLIDDGSTDGSSQLCDELAKVDNRIKVFHKSNGGVSSARNAGIRNAQGEWITFIDSDDWIECNFLSVLLSFSSEELVVGGFTRYGDIEDRYASKENCTINICNDLPSMWSIVPRGFVFWYVWGKLYRRDIIKSYNVFFNEELRYSEDNCFLLEYMSHIDNFACVRSFGYNHLYEKYRAKKYMMDFHEFRKHVDIQKQKTNLLEKKIQSNLFSLKISVYGRFLNSYLYHLFGINDYSLYKKELYALKNYIAFEEEGLFIINHLRNRIKRWTLKYVPIHLSYLLRNIQKFVLFSE